MAVVGLIVPTLGDRPAFFRECLQSIRRSAKAHVCVVAPRNSSFDGPLFELCDQVLEDPGQGLAAAINAGAKALPEEVKYLNWLGDDDVLIADGHYRLVEALQRDPQTVLAYGHCQYIDAMGTVMFRIRSGHWAEPLLQFGPQMISQPAILFRRDIFQRVNGLDESLSWAFDLDLLLKLRKLGRFEAVSHVVASYRWHESALTVGGRRQSVLEASTVRKSHLSPRTRRWSTLWEPVMRRLIELAGRILSR